MPGLDAFGTELQRGDGATPTEVFTAIANVTSIEGPGIERETLDVTAHNSPDGWMEFVGGLKDGGEVELEVNYDPSDHDTLIADFEDEAPRNYRLVFPDPAATTWGLSLILTGFEPEAPYDDKLAAAITFKVNGKPTLT
jgi:predicted secreted protein